MFGSIGRVGPRRRQKKSSSRVGIGVFRKLAMNVVCADCPAKTVFEAGSLSLAMWTAI